MEKLRKNKFISSIMTLMTGSVIAQVISVLVSPLMTRLYTEEQIGEYTLILTAVSMFGTVLCARYDQSIVSEPNEHNAYALVKLSFLVTVVLSVIVGIGYTVYYEFTDSLSISLWETLFWIILLLFFTGVGHIITSYNNRFKQYKLMSATHVGRTIGKEGALVGFGLLNMGSLGLLISQLLGVSLGLGSQGRSLWKNRDKLKVAKTEDVIAVARTHIRQPLFSVPASFANSFSYSVINIFVNSLYGTAVLAHYSMSFRMLGLPLSLISVNVSKAYFQKASREYDEKGSFCKTFLQTSLILLAVAVPMVILLVLFAPWAFEVFFGEGWGQAGVYVQYLAPLFGVRLIVGALTPTMTICNKQNFELIIQGLFVVSGFLIYYLSANGAAIGAFLIGISALFSAVYLVFYLVMLKLSFSNKKGENANG